MLYPLSKVGSVRSMKERPLALTLVTVNGYESNIGKITDAQFSIEENKPFEK